MPFTVRCNIDGCPFEEQVVADFDAALDLQDEHRARRGDPHVLELERVGNATEADDD